MSKKSVDQTSLTWTSSAEDFLAPISPPPAKAPASTETQADSGGSTPGSSKRSARASSLSKTLRPLLRAGWIELSLSSDGSLIGCTDASLPPLTWVRRTSENDSSSWRTPCATEGKAPKTRARREDGREILRLATQVLEQEKMRSPAWAWPTPVTTDAKGARRATAKTDAWTSHDGTTLLDAVRMWPTPTATPPATPYGTTNNGDPGDGRGQYATAGTPWLTTLASKGGGHLNPAWVECLVGLPPGWTDGPFDPLTLILFPRD